LGKLRLVLGVGNDDGIGNDGIGGIVGNVGEVGMLGMGEGDAGQRPVVGGWKRLWLMEVVVVLGVGMLEVVGRWGIWLLWLVVLVVL
jgi:hypothetical protein